MKLLKVLTLIIFALILIDLTLSAECTNNINDFLPNVNLNQGPKFNQKDSSYIKNNFVIGDYNKNFIVKDQNSITILSTFLDNSFFYKATTFNENYIFSNDNFLDLIAERNLNYMTDVNQVLKQNNNLYLIRDNNKISKYNFNDNSFSDNFYVSDNINAKKYSYLENNILYSESINGGFSIFKLEPFSLLYNGFKNYPEKIQCIKEWCLESLSKKYGNYYYTITNFHESVNSNYPAILMFDVSNPTLPIILKKRNIQSANYYDSLDVSDKYVFTLSDVYSSDYNSNKIKLSVYHKNTLNPVFENKDVDRLLINNTSNLFLDSESMIVVDNSYLYILSYMYNESKAILGYSTGWSYVLSILDVKNSNSIKYVSHYVLCDNSAMGSSSDLLFSNTKDVVFFSANCAPNNVMNVNKELYYINRIHAKTAQYNHSTGYCHKLTECYFDNSEDMKCIDNKDSPNDYDDLVCFNGNWSTRTNELYQFTDAYGKRISAKYFIACQNKNALSECILYDYTKNKTTYSVLDYKNPSTILNNFGITAVCQIENDFSKCLSNKFNVYSFAEKKNSFFIVTNYSLKPNYVNSIPIIMSKQLFKSNNLGKTHEEYKYISGYNEQTDVITESLIAKINNDEKVKFENTKTSILEKINQINENENFLIYSNPNYYIINNSYAVDYYSKSFRGFSSKELQYSIAYNDLKSGYLTFSKCLFDKSYNMSYFPEFNINYDKNILVQTLPTYPKEAGCCKNTSCFNGFYCLDGFKKSDIFLNNPFLIERYRYPYGDDQNFVCVQGMGWAKAYKKYNFDESQYGYCLYNSSCWYDRSVGCLNDGDYIGEAFCDNGTYVSRSSMIAHALLNITDIGANDYSLYCDNMVYSLNDPLIGFSNIHNSINSLCVLDYNKKTVFGFSANSDILDQVLANLDLTINRTLYPLVNFNNCNFQSENKFSPCNDNQPKQLWFNKRLNSYIVTRYSADLSNPSFFSSVSNFVDYLLFPFRNILNLYSSSSEKKMLALNTKALGIYINQNKSASKDILGFVTKYNGTKMMFVYYKNYENANLCSSLDLSKVYCKYDSILKTHTLKMNGTVVDDYFNGFRYIARTR